MSTTIQEIQIKYPEMKPVKSVPPLFRFNGFGVSVFGKRDLDTANGTYVKTLCISFVFLPVFALAAYRVADAENGGWYFIGKVPLSRFAAGWNKLVALLLVCAIGSGMYASHTSSPGYVDGKKMAEASEALASGRTNHAIQVYAGLSISGGPRQEDARQALQPIAEKLLLRGSQKEKSFIIRQLAHVHRNSPGRPLVASLESEALKEARLALDTNPQHGLQIVDFMKPIATNKVTFAELHMVLLEKLAAKQLATAEQVSELAILYEAKGEKEKSIQVLLPYREKLKDSEGARILGQELLASGEYEGAYQLLFPYVETRLKSMESALKGYSQSIELAGNKILDELNSSPHATEYKRIAALKKADQQKAVDEYIGLRIKSHPLVKRAMERISEVSKIVPVAFDLGVTQMTRARGMADLQARAREMQAAEKTFLSISSVAGESAQFKISLAEVSYWLGREQEGRKRFEDALDTDKRSYEVLVQVAPVLRTIGEQKWAYQLSEEAFKKGKNAQERDQAAILCSVTSPDIDGKIQWLEKLKDENPMNAIHLFEAKAQKAELSGMDEEANKNYLLALQKYKSLPDSVASFNNQALCCLALYRLTGKMSYRQLSSTLQKKAMELDPQNSIILFNTANGLLGEAFLDVAGEGMNMEIVRAEGSLRLMGFLYNNVTQKEALFAKIKSKESYRKFWELLDRTLLLAPKNSNAYSLAMSVYGWIHDLDGLKRLQEQLARVELDVSQQRTEALEYFAGKKDAQRLEERKRMALKFAQLLKGVNEKEEPVSFAYLATFVVALDLLAMQQDQAVDLDECVRLAERAYKSSTSSASRGVLLSALAARAMKVLAKEHPDVEALVKRTKRSLSSNLQLAWLLSKDAETAQKLVSNPDVQRYFLLERETAQCFPGTFHPIDWAQFRHTDPELADVIKQVLMKTQESALLRGMEHLLEPYSGEAILSSYWQALLTGDQVAARRYLEEGAKAGVPLP